MDIDQFEQLRDVSQIVPTVTAMEFYADGDRTLLYGYDVHRITWHVYVQDGEIHKVTYDYQGPLNHESSVIWRLADLVPNKRAYPDRTDYRFAVLASQRGVDICFTTFDESTTPAQFYGRRA